MTRHNIAIIVDTSASMNVGDKDSSCGISRLACTMSGVRTLLGELSPCDPRKARCGKATRSRVANAVDTVSLFAFPNVTVGTASNDYNCGGKNPTTLPYSLPAPEASAYSPTVQPESTPTYRIVDFSSDYRTSGRTKALNPDSDIVKAVNGVSGCAGLRAPGGESTYYAGAIYAAQASLVAEHAARPRSQNVIILISDGDANARRNQMARSATSSGAYPSWVDECGQAITAAKAASTVGTKVYAVAYGGDSAGRCPTDTSGPYQGFSSCQTMMSIATSAEFFFSSPTVFYSSSLGGSYRTLCESKAHPATDMNEIFTQIAASIKVPQGRQGKTQSASLLKSFK